MKWKASRVPVTSGPYGLVQAAARGLRLASAQPTSSACLGSGGVPPRAMTSASSCSPSACSSITWASTQNRQRLARDTADATSSRSTRDASPASRASRISAQVAASTSGTAESAWKVGTGPRNSSRSCR